MTRLLAAFTATAAGVWCARLVARRRQIVSHPNPIVPTHTAPVPYLGGAGIFVPYLLLLLIFGGAAPWALVLAGAVFVFLVLGTADDLHPLPWWFRLAVEVVIVAGLLFGLAACFGLRLHPLVLALGTLAVALLANGVNVLDVSDGLAASVGAIAALGLCLAFLYASDRPLLALPALLLAGGLASFLLFNRPPATIYLGDGGSLPIGLVIGTLTFLWLVSGPIGPTRLVVALSLVSLPVFEVALISYDRIRARRSVVRASPAHFALRLGRLGWSRTQVLVTSSGVALMLAAAPALVRLPGIVTWGYAAIVLAGYLAAFCLLSRIRVDP